MKKLGVSPTSPTGRFPYTVPGALNFQSYTPVYILTSSYSVIVIADPSSEPGGKPTYVSDSWEIAVYLERTYPPPKYPALFPHNSAALQRAMTTALSRTVHSALCDLAISLIGVNHVLDDRGHEYFIRTREAMFKKPLAEVLQEEDSKWSTDIKTAWLTIGQMLDINGPMQEVGPFVMGKQVSYSDFIIAGLLIWLRRGEGIEGRRWKEVFDWDNGRWGAIWKEVEIMEAKSTEV
jgi:glutathione S-transferase